MGYSIINRAAISQAAAGLGQAYRDGIFTAGLGQTMLDVRAHQRLRAYRDGVFSRGVGAIDVLDLSDPSVMKEVKVALSLTMDPTLASDEAWLKNPTWDSKAEALYMKLVDAYQGPPEAKAGLVTMQAGHAVPTVLGIIGLGQSAALVIGEDKVKAALPILYDFIDAHGTSGGKVLGPKLAGGAAEAGMFSTKTLVGVGVGIAVIGLGWMIFKK